MAAYSVRTCLSYLSSNFKEIQNTACAGFQKTILFYLVEDTIEYIQYCGDKQQI